MVAIDHPGSTGKRSRSKGLALLYDPAVRGLVFQLVAVVAAIAVVAFAVTNAITNLREQGIASGFSFLGQTAGFAILQTLIPYSEVSSYGRAFVVGLLNTLLVAVVGIVLASLLGFFIGVLRLSSNWLIRQMAAGYIEIFRNIPLLLQLFFWYFAVLKQLPPPRQSMELGFGAHLSIRGLVFPVVEFGQGSGLAGILLLVAIVASLALRRWAKRRQDRSGERFPVLWSALGLIIVLPLIGLAIVGFPLTIERPELRGFNFTGGVNVEPELVALLLGLVIYTAAFIAEIVRAGILAVDRGQREASAALGLRPNTAMRLVIIPQALRVIVPPLTNQYLNLTKNSSLAVAIGYPDLVSVFAGTVLNQTGQAVEVIAITMLVYLSLSLLTSMFMNWFNRRIALVER